MARTLPAEDARARAHDLELGLGALVGGSLATLAGASTITAAGTALAGLGLVHVAHVSGGRLLLVPEPLPPSRRFCPPNSPTSCTTAPTSRSGR